MGVRDRFYTARTARAILSWRILIGVGVAVATAVAGVPIVGAIAIGIGAYAASVFVAMPRGPERPNIDPFTLSEPWRQLIQQAQGSSRNLRRTVDGVDEGPLKLQLTAIADQLDQGLHEAWEVAKRGDEIDETVRNLDPTRLRSKLGTLLAQAGDDPSAANAASIASVEQQLASADRLKQRSADAAESLRAAQTQLDELVARASEVRVGSADTDTYAREVDDLVIKLEALHQALEETQPG